MDQTTITGSLPNMTVEISHHADPEAGAELMTISLRATPDFQSALPLVAGLSQLSMGQLSLDSPLLAPLQMWTGMMQAWLTPWRALLGQDDLIAANPLARLLGEQQSGQ